MWSTYTWSSPLPKHSFMAMAFDLFSHCMMMSLSVKIRRVSAEPWRPLTVDREVKTSEKVGFAHRPWQQSEQRGKKPPENREYRHKIVRCDGAALTMSHDLFYEGNSQSGFHRFALFAA